MSRMHASLVRAAAGGTRGDTPRTPRFTLERRGDQEGPGLESAQLSTEAGQVQNRSGYGLGCMLTKTATSE
jgi:hypothetical protein